MGNELKMTIRASGTTKQFIMHVHTVIHMYKQMGLDTNFANAEKAATNAKLDAKLAKMEYAQVFSSEKRKNKGNESDGAIRESKGLVVAMANYERALKAIEAAKLTFTMEGAKPFVYGNLFFNSARQPWEKSSFL